MVPAPTDKLTKDAGFLPLQIRAMPNQTEKTEAEDHKPTAPNNQSTSSHQQKSSPPIKPGTLTNSSLHKDLGHNSSTSHNSTANTTTIANTTTTANTTYTPPPHAPYSNLSSIKSTPPPLDPDSTSSKTINLNEYGPEAETSAGLPSGVPRPSVLCGIIIAALVGCATIIWLGSRLLLSIRRKRSKANRKKWIPPKPNQRGPKEENELEIIKNERDSIGKDFKYLSSSSNTQTCERFSELDQFHQHPSTPPQPKSEDEFTRWWQEKQWNEDTSTLNHKRPESVLSKHYESDQLERNSWMGFRKLSVCSSSGGSHSSHSDKRIGNYDHGFNNMMGEPKKKVKVDGWLGTVGEEAGCRSSMGSTWSQESWEEFEAYSSICPSDSASRVPYPHHHQPQPHHHHSREPSLRRTRLVSIQELPPIP